MFVPVRTALVEKLYDMNERFRCEHSGGETAPFLREAADEIMRLLRERDAIMHRVNLVWRAPDTAPPDTEVEVRVGAMAFLAKLVPGGGMTMDGDDCDQWQATRDGEHPPCWSDGCCWASNEDEDPSMPVEAWRPVIAAPGIDARSAETGTGSARQGESPVTEGQAPSDQRGPP